MAHQDTPTSQGTRPTPTVPPIALVYAFRYLLSTIYISVSACSHVPIQAHLGHEINGNKIHESEKSIRSNMIKIDKVLRQGFYTYEGRSPAQIPTVRPFHIRQKMNKPSLPTNHAKTTGLVERAVFYQADRARQMETPPGLITVIQRQSYIDETGLIR